MLTKNLAPVFNALGDPTRYKIMQLLGKNPSYCVSELAKECDITPAGVSQHLNVLQDAGVLEPVRNGKKMCYKLVGDPVITKLIKLVKGKN